MIEKASLINSLGYFGDDRKIENWRVAGKVVGGMLLILTSTFNLTPKILPFPPFLPASILPNMSSSQPTLMVIP